MCRDRSSQKKYELKENSLAPATTSAMLFDRGNNEFAASIDLSDPDGLMDDQETGDRGWCDLCGSEFEAIQAVCSA